MSEDRLSGIVKETAGLFIASVVASSILLSKRYARKSAMMMNQNKAASGSVITSAFGNSFVASFGSLVAAGAYFRLRAGEINVIILNSIFILVVI